jgi:GNAT superfamily N-acetyltransferase
MEIEIRSPKTDNEWIEYYDLRYRILRKPWNQPIGSERNEGDSSEQHFAMYSGINLLAVGRLDKCEEKKRQIRFMAVEKNEQGSGFGKLLMIEMEKYCRNDEVNEIILHARESAILFYEKLSYQLQEPSYKLFGEIQHYLMSKKL